MKITDIEIRLCKHQEAVLSEKELRDSHRSELNFLMITMKTDAGVDGVSMGFAGMGAEMAGSIAAQSIKPFFLGKDPFAREKHWHEFRRYERHWHHTPIYSYGPFDIALWDIAGVVAGLPLYKLFGHCRAKAPTYVSSMYLDTPQDYADQAAEFKRKGFHGYKLHPPSDFQEALEAYRLCREAVGDDPSFKLMADPVTAHTYYEEALRMGRELEKLDYYWFEEPLYDTDFNGLRKLTRDLDIPICGTEVLVGSHYSTAECIASGVVDIVRSDVSWKGGVTAVMKTAHLAEAFGMRCEVHTTIYPALEIVNLHCCCAIANCEFFEALIPSSLMKLGIKNPVHIDEDGYAHPPSGAGLGIEWDWDFIDNATVAVM
ncbi:MAG: mandelate racemase [Chloroflexota bacterium]|nr:mandelate racemase [Chloroflexota bacterium]MDE2907633.1 mandelate racemase [Chloroflexota bacterium]